MAGIDAGVGDGVGMYVERKKFFAAKGETASTVKVIQSKITSKYRSTFLKYDHFFFLLFFFFFFFFV